VLKKFVKAAGFGIEARKREFTSIDRLNKLIALYKATCGAAATKVFHPTCLSCRPVFMLLLYADSLQRTLANAWLLILPL